MVLSDWEIESLAKELARLYPCKCELCVKRHENAAIKRLKEQGVEGPTIPVDKVVSFLETYNKWRRGDDTVEQPNPTELDKVIDHAIYYLSKKTV